MQIHELYQKYLKHPSIQTDSRKIKEGDIFFALKGPNFNGNAYAKKALDDGAAFCIVDEDIDPDDDRLIRVPDVLQALQELALHHRKQFTIPFIAITGSNGKTTTKELVHAVLSTTFRTYTTEGNLNNHIGVPLTILKIRADAEMAIIEMGANHQQEIAGYCRYALPTHGLINNCGKAHLEGFGGIEGVRKGKGELFDFLRENNGTAFVYWDYDYLQDMSHDIPHIIRYGSLSDKNKLDYAAEIAQPGEFLEVRVTKGASIDRIHTKLVGDYNLPNVIAAIAIGKYFAVPDVNIHTAIEAYIPTNSRSQLLVMGSNKIILDAYNANPNSMKAAIENFSRMDADKKILILGAMMEMGAESESEHRRLVDLIKGFHWDHVVLVGKEFTDVPSSFKHFNKTQEARDWFMHEGIHDAMILLKGSRSMQMEKVLD